MAGLTRSLVPSENRPSATLLLGQRARPGHTVDAEYRGRPVRYYRASGQQSRASQWATQQASGSDAQIKPVGAMHGCLCRMHMQGLDAVTVSDVRCRCQCLCAGRQRWRQLAGSAIAMPKSPVKRCPCMVRRVDVLLAFGCTFSAPQRADDTRQGGNFETGARVARAPASAGCTAPLTARTRAPLTATACQRNTMRAERQQLVHDLVACLARPRDPSSAHPQPSAPGSSRAESAALRRALRVAEQPARDPPLALDEVRTRLDECVVRPCAPCAQAD